VKSCIVGQNLCADCNHCEFFGYLLNSYTRGRMDLQNYSAGFLPSGGAAKPQECLLPFKVLPYRMTAKRQARNCKSIRPRVYYTLRAMSIHNMLSVFSFSSLLMSIGVISIFPSCAATTTVSPAFMLPSNIFSAAVSSTALWIARRRGRAP